MESTETKCIYCEGELVYHSEGTHLCTSCRAIVWDERSRQQREALTDIPCKKGCGGRLVQRYPGEDHTDYYCVKCTAGHGHNAELDCDICAGTVVDGQCEMCDATYENGVHVPDYIDELIDEL